MSKREIVRMKMKRTLRGMFAFVNFNFLTRRTFSGFAMMNVVELCDRIKTWRRKKNKWFKFHHPRLFTIWKLWKWLSSVNIVYCSIIYWKRWWDETDEYKTLVARNCSHQMCFQSKWIKVLYVHIRPFQKKHNC